MKSKLHPEKEKERSQAFDSSRSPKKATRRKAQIRSNKNCCCPYHVIISRSSSKVPYPPGKAIIASAWNPLIRFNKIPLSVISKSSITYNVETMGDVKVWYLQGQDRLTRIFDLWSLLKPHPYWKEGYRSHPQRMIAVSQLAMYFV